MAGDDAPQISILDARLAEIDRRLRHIQTDLAEEIAAPSGDGLPPRIAVPEPGGERVGRTAPPTVQAGARRRAALGSAAAPVASARRTGDDDAGDDAQLVVAELRGLISDHARLLDRLGEILASGERVLVAARSAAAPSAPAAPRPSGGPEPGEITVSAGPFTSIEAVRGFERALRSLPGVDGAEVRGYESGDRALVDVHLSSENP